MRTGSEGLEDMDDLEDMRKAFASAAGPPPAPEECPDPERTWAAVHGELPPGEVREIVDHTARCAACAEDWRLAAEMVREGPAALPAFEDVEPPERQEVMPPPPRSGRLAPLFALAAAACLVLAVLIPWRSHEARPPVIRESPATELRSLAPDRLPRERFVLRWSDAGAGAAYDVEISREAGFQTVVTKRSLDENRLTVPADALAGLPAGTRLIWRVTARLRDGRTQSETSFVTLSD